MALSVDGKVFAWGLNVCGQLGVGATPDRDTPVLVRELAHEKIKCISAGQLHSGATAESGELYMWGHNPDCRIFQKIDHHRNPDDRDQFLPYHAEIRDDKNIKRLIDSVACGTDHTIVIDT